MVRIDEVFKGYTQRIMRRWINGASRRLRMEPREQAVNAARISERISERRETFDDSDSHGIRFSLRIHGARKGHGSVETEKLEVSYTITEVGRPELLLPEKSRSLDELDSGGLMKYQEQGRAHLSLPEAEHFYRYLSRLYWVMTKYGSQREPSGG